MKNNRLYLIVLVLSMLIVSLSGCVHCNDLEEPYQEMDSIENHDRSAGQGDDSLLEDMSNPDNDGGKDEPIEITDDEDDEDDSNR